MSGWQERTRSKAPKGDKPLRREVTDRACRGAGKRRDGTRLGKPDTGNPFVRFDEERSGSAKLTTTVGSIRLLPLRLLYAAAREGGCARG